MKFLAPRKAKFMPEGRGERGCQGEGVPGGTAQDTWLVALLCGSGGLPALGTRDVTASPGSRQSNIKAEDICKGSTE